MKFAEVYTLCNLFQGRLTFKILFYIQNRLFDSSIVLTLCNEIVPYHRAIVQCRKEFRHPNLADLIIAVKHYTRNSLRLAMGCMALILVVLSGIFSEPIRVGRLMFCCSSRSFNPCMVSNYRMLTHIVLEKWIHPL